MTSRDELRDRAHDLGLDRLSIFVPAVMSVGLLFWVSSEVTQLLRARAEETAARRARIQASAVVDQLLDRPPDHTEGARPRFAYLLLAVSLAAVAVYTVVGSVGNFLNEGYYVEGIAWLLAAAAVVALVASYYAVVALIVFLTWPVPPAWVRGTLLSTPLGTAPAPVESGRRPSWVLTAAVVAGAVATAVAALFVVGSPELADSFDRWLGEWFQLHDPFPSIGVVGLLGRTEVAIGVTLLAGLAAFRCRVLATVYLMSVTLALTASLLVRPLVGRPRAEVGSMLGSPESFPDGAVVLAVLFAGLFPLALAVLFERRWIVAPTRVVLGLLVVAGMGQQLAAGGRPLDVLGGALLGLTLVLAAQWVVSNEASHRSCHHCPWNRDGRAEPIRGAVPIRPEWHTVLRVVAGLTAAAATVVMAFLAFEVQIPSDPSGYGLGPGIEHLVEVGLAGLLGVGALVSWRWPGVGAVMIAVAAAGAGVFAAVAYRPALAILFTVGIMVPAFLLWLSWQHRRRPVEIVAVAVTTALLMGATWGGATSVYDHFFGPIAPRSSTAAEPVDRVEWVWAGGLSDRGIVVTARVVREVRSASLRVVAPDGAEVRSDETTPDGDRLVGFAVDGLRADTAYEYRVVVEGADDRGRGHGTFRTAPTGASSFEFTVASCAITGSDAAVFDALREEAPQLHLAIGDMHYSNVESTAPGPYVDAWSAALESPSQAAWARSVPMGYIWDDHDYGPNDADYYSPGRAAARDAYRRAAPHYPVEPGDAPIYQAFTIGRVRFVLTDSRSQRTPESMLGDEQEAWLLGELEQASRTHALVVWASSVPWIGPDEPGADSWWGWPDERARISEFIESHGIDNLVMVAGDAHMVAIDDGSHSNYSTLSGRGFPVLQAAALDRPGSVKGGPYSEGTFPGAGQYGVVQITDDGGPTVAVRMVGRTWDGRDLVAWEGIFPVGERAGSVTAPIG